MRLIANARMYSVTPVVEEAWRSLLDKVSAMADVELVYTPYPAPQPLEPLWRRPDLGCVFMCGYPIALGLADVEPIAAPIPDAPWVEGRAFYRSDLIVRAESPYRTLADTFGGTVGWTVEHSHSGFNALRHHLLPFRRPGNDPVFRRAIGSLVTARKILDSVIDGTIDVGPLDGYWHLLIRKHMPELLAKVRVLASTELAPIPAFVASRGTPSEVVARLRAALLAASGESWFGHLGEVLCLQGFEAVHRQSFDTSLQWARDAEAAGYPFPA